MDKSAKNTKIKLLLSSDDYVYFYNGNYYFREFGNILVVRYLAVFEFVRLVVRVKNVNSEVELGPYNIPITDSRIEIYPIPFFQGAKQYLFKYFKIKDVINKSIESCDAAIFRIPSTNAFSVLKIARKKRIPFAVEIVANPKELALESRSIIFRILMLILHYKQISACRHANGVSYVTEFALQKVYPAVKSGHFQSYYSSVELSDSFYGGAKTYPEGKIIISHVSNPIKTYTKGHKTVIEIVKILRDMGYNVEARFAGEGEFVSRFVEYAKKMEIADKVTFVGFLKQGELKTFLSNSDMMILPTKSEGLPRALIEAMAVGLPCLSSPVGGISELTSDELLFDISDSKGFASKVAEIIEDPELYCRLSSIAFKKSIEYKAEVLQKRRIEFYQKLKSIL